MSVYRPLGECVILILKILCVSYIWAKTLFHICLVVEEVTHGLNDDLLFVKSFHCSKLVKNPSDQS